MRTFQIHQSPLSSLHLFDPRFPYSTHRPNRFHASLFRRRKMPRSKTLMDFFPLPKAKRPKTVSAFSDARKYTDEDVGSASQDPSDSAAAASGSLLTAEARARVELKKSIAKAKRNLKTCLQKVADSKGGRGYVLLEELLVEKTWLDVLPGELQKPYAKNLCTLVEREMISGSIQIYPPSHLIFNALNTTPFDKVKVVILGQDPYHGPGQAMGLCFSVPEGVKSPSSLVNIFKEIKEDIGCSIPCHGNLERWALQGVLLLNTVLTVRRHQANSHAKKGWEQFTDAVIRTVSEKKSGVVFLLWGNSAREKSRLIDATKHHVLEAAHPSGLSAHKGFFGCRHFSRTNQIIKQKGETPIDWQL